MEVVEPRSASTEPDDAAWEPLRESKVPPRSGDPLNWNRLPKEVKILLLDTLDPATFCNMRAVSKKWYNASLQSSRNADVLLIVRANKAAAVQARDSLKRTKRLAAYRRATGGCFWCIYFAVVIIAFTALMVGGVLLGIGSSPYVLNDEWKDAMCRFDRAQQTGLPIFSFQLYSCSLSDVANRSIFSVNGGMSAVFNLSARNLKCPGRNSDYVYEELDAILFLLSRSSWPCVDTGPGSPLRYPPSNSAKAGLFILNTKVQTNFTFAPYDSVKWTGVACLGFCAIIGLFSLFLIIVVCTKRNWGPVEA